MSNLSHRDSATSEFVCPKCGSPNIYELSLCVVIHYIRRWGADGIPEEYEDDPEVDWESDMPYDNLLGPNRKKMALTFECDNCTAQFEHPQRAAGLESKNPG